MRRSILLRPSTRAPLAIAAATVLGIGCDRGGDAARQTAPAETAESVDTAVRVDGDAVTLRSGSTPHLVGDPIPLLVMAEPADGAMAAIELPEDGRLGPFEFVVRPAPRISGLPMGSAVVSLELSTFESGDLVVPPIEATFEQRPGGRRRVLASAPLEITVRSVLPETGAGTASSDPLEAIRPLKSPVPMIEGGPDRPAIWWIASVGLTAAMLLGGFLLLSRRRGPAEPPPAVWARRRLADLRTSDASRTPSDRWAEIASLVRGLLARRDGLDTLDRTSGEIRIALAADARFSPEERDAIMQLLEQADLAKFAGGSERDPGPALDVVERLVESGEDRTPGRLQEAAP